MKQSLFALAATVAVLTAPVAMAADATIPATYEPNKGEFLSEYQQQLQYIDRFDFKLSEGSQTYDLSDFHRIAHQDRISLHFVNDTAMAQNVYFPALDRNFMIPANSERDVEFNANLFTTTQWLKYEVSSLETGKTNVIAQSQELMNIINEKIVIPTFAEETEVSYKQSTPAYTPQSNAPVRGYW